MPTHRAAAPAAHNTPLALYADAFWQALGGPPDALAHLAFRGEGALPSVFAVSDFAAAAVGTAGLALAELVAAATGHWPEVETDRRLASFWFSSSLRPEGWAPPPLWDPIAGNYRGADGWIRLHTNAPHHRDAALAVLGVPVDRDAVAAAVAHWPADALEAAIVARHGCAAAMRSVQAWSEHPQGQAVWHEPLLHRQRAAPAPRPDWPIPRERPLRGIRVLDLTRILAGPTATRFLAGYGADVLRIDPYGWEEPGTVPEVVLGKRCARLDLKRADDLAHFERLLGGADVLIHGYRSDALERLGLGTERRRQLNPGLVDVSLDAYGWSGPWAARRGFDSLVQMSTGIAEAGMRAARSDTPVPLPVQALDYATGYLLAGAALRGLIERVTHGTGSTVRASLARTAKLLIEPPAAPEPTLPFAAETPDDLAAPLEATAWGPARRLKPPCAVADAPSHWDYPAGALGTAPAEWR